MGRIFAGQTSLRLVCETGTDLTEAAVVRIRCRKPDGTGIEFEAAVSDAEGGVIFYELFAGGGEIDQAGWWTFWAWAEFSDGRSAAGEAARGFVWGEGEG